MGKTMQVVNVALAPGQKIQTSPGSMMYMSGDVRSEVDCSDPCARCCGGEACVMNVYENAGGAPGYIGLTPAVPADMKPHPRPTNERFVTLAGTGDQMPANGLGMCCRASAYDDESVRRSVLWYLLQGGRQIRDRRISCRRG